MPLKTVLALAITAAAFAAAVAAALIVLGRQAIDREASDTPFVDQLSGEEVICAHVNGERFCRPLNDPEQPFAPVLPRR